MTIAPLPYAAYGVIAADPPWRFENYSAKGEIKSAKRHYPTMPTDEIIALYEPLNLEFVCSPDSVLLLWATPPMLEDAMKVMKAFGFKYKTMGLWHKLTKRNKDQFGTGYIYRSAAEPWILGTRGEPKICNKSIRNLVTARIREHSRKPDRFYRDIEKLFHGPYIELFARQARPHWDAWGLEINKFDGDNVVPLDQYRVFHSPQFRKAA